MDMKLLFKNYGLKSSTVEVGEQTWHVQELTASVIEQIRLTEKKESELSMSAVAVIGGVVDEEGKHVFKMSDKKVILETLTVKDLMKVTNEIFKISGLSDSEE